MKRLIFTVAGSARMNVLARRLSRDVLALFTGVTLFVPVAWAQRDSVKTVLIIVMSDQPWSRIAGSQSAPYINGVLLPMGSYARNYFAPPGNLLPESNYLWLEAGSNFGVTTNGSPSINHQTTGTHLVTLLGNAGISWKTYQEGIDGSTCPLTDTAQYKTESNPFIFFDDVTGNLNPASPSCLGHVRPYSELAADLTSNNVARYIFIKPNPCNSMHPSCTSAADHIKQGDEWLAQEVPKILSSPAYKSGGALFITWDITGDQSDGPLGMIVLSPFAKSNYSNLVRYTHGSTLRTIQEILDVKPLLGDAASETSLDDFFSLPAIGSAGITLTWTSSPSATSYRVKRAATPGGPFTTIATGIPSNSFTDRGLTSGTTYYYVVTAVNGSGESPPSAQISATPIFVPPAPTNLTVKQTP
jgi:phosphatidylinositol-3-phosphatase